MFVFLKLDCNHENKEGLCLHLDTDVTEELMIS